MKSQNTILQNLKKILYVIIITLLTLVLFKANDSDVKAVTQCCDCNAWTSCNGGTTTPPPPSPPPPPPNPTSPPSPPPPSPPSPPSPPDPPSPPPPPSPVVVSTNINQLVGTEINTDNGVSCTDNNPFTFSITYRHPQSNSKLDRMLMWIDASSPTNAQANSSIQGSIRQQSGLFTILGKTCNGSPGTCTWNLVGNNSPYTNRNICTTTNDYSSHLESGNECTSQNRIGSWSVTSISKPNNKDIVVTYKVWIDKTLGTNLNIYGSATATTGTSAAWKDVGNILADFEPPLITFSDIHTVTGSRQVQVPWSVNDQLSNVAEIRGYASLALSGLQDGPIDNVTSGIYDYAIDGTDSRDLWQVTNPISGTESIDLKSNEGNQIEFGGYSTDEACNQGTSVTGSNIIEPGQPWLSTKGGHLYAGQAYYIPTPGIVDNGYYLTRDSNIWMDPFRFKVDTFSTGDNDVSISTELITNSANSILIPDSSSNPATGFGLANFNPNYNFDDDILNPIPKLRNDVSSIPLDATTIDTTTANKSTDLVDCDATLKNCIFTRDGNLKIETTSNKAFTCNKPTVFIVNGDLQIDTDIQKGTNTDDGCLFVVQGNTVIKPGIKQTLTATCNTGNLEDSTKCYPSYDTLEAFILAKGSITIQEDNSQGGLLYEGLLVHGSLIGLGNSASRGINWQRTLKVSANTRFPSTVIHYDPVYLEIARHVFDTSPNSYVTDVGYKP